jgi:hypothetical protein
LSAVSTLLGIPPADQPTRGWHVSPLVDVLAYHFSWLWILVPLVLAGPQHPADYFNVFVVGMTVSFIHRHFTMPYVYLDAHVFRTHVYRFTVFPLLMVVGFLATPFLWKWKVPPEFFQPMDAAFGVTLALLGYQWWSEERRGHAVPLRAVGMGGAGVAGAVAIGLATGAVSLVGALGALVATLALTLDGRKTPGPRASARWLPLGLGALALAVTTPPAVAALRWPGEIFAFKAVIQAIAFAAAAWNVWHVFMQKYGILRLYAAKSECAPERRTPGWVDRLLIFGWFPLYLVVLGPANRPLILREAKSVKAYLLPMADAMEAWQAFLFAPAALLVAGAIAAFLAYEWRANRLRNIPRLSMALGVIGLSTAFFFFSPLKVYIAYGFSHALEYMVFVWAYQRRRYAAPLAHRPLIQRLIQWPVLWYGGFVLAFALGYLWLDYADEYGVTAEPVKLFGVRGASLLFYWTIWHSMVHFYFDGFLWKMRLPQVRANV